MLNIAILYQKGYKYAIKTFFFESYQYHFEFLGRSFNSFSNKVYHLYSINTS